MAMHEVHLENDKRAIWINNTREQNEERLTVSWKTETVVVDPTPTPLNKLKESISHFNQLREKAGLKQMFVVTTFHRGIIEKILDQPDTQGLRLYLSIDAATGTVEPVMVAVNGIFEDIISGDDQPGDNFFCGVDSKCPPPEPIQNCPRTLLLLPDVNS